MSITQILREHNELIGSVNASVGDLNEIVAHLIEVTRKQQKQIDRLLAVTPLAQERQP